MSDLVSVMMPARNAAKHIREAIESIQAQTYENWELIFVDDGSVDGTLEIVQDIASLDSRIRIHVSKHVGRGAARNLCISMARGQFIAVCDSDDVCCPDRFRRQVEFLRANPLIGVVGGGWVPFVDDIVKGALPPQNNSLDSKVIARAFRRGKMRFHNASAMIRFELFSKFGLYNVGLRRAQDYEFFSRLARGGVSFYSLRENLIYYRMDAKIPSLGYFVENGIYMSYADYLLAGGEGDFEGFLRSIEGRVMLQYFKVKYLYFYAKKFFGF